MKKISLLGSTGSIGTQTLEVVSEHSDELEIVALAASSSVDSMEEQIRRYHPKAACMYDEAAALKLKERVKDTDVEVLKGMEGLITLASMEEADIVLTAVVGMIGIRPTIAAIEAGKDVAIANKETLVCAGHIIMPLVRENGTRLFPVDSEHSAIWQSLMGNEHKRIEKILLTASGGPFRGKTRDELKAVKPADALKHPNWSMGKKVTIDSASLVNKGLEVMEASWLFDVKPERIQVVVQPESMIHSMVQYEDGSVIAQLSVPTMKLPIQFALFYPDRRTLDIPRIDFEKPFSLSFDAPDDENFPGLKLALEAAKAGGTMPTVFNAANEALVRLFLNERIGFTDITDGIKRAMDAAEVTDSPGVDEILRTEAWTKSFVEDIYSI